MPGCVVVVEDEPQILQLLRDVLEMEGYDVLGLEDPDGVDSALDGVQPSLFLLDIMLPGMSGVELAQYLRRHGYESTPMIAMSASKLMVAVAEGSNTFDAAIEKPFDVDALLNQIEQYALKAS